MKQTTLSLIISLLAAPLFAEGPGNAWQDPQVNAINRLPMHTDFTPLEQENLSLHGLWKFNFVHTPSEAPCDFYQVGYDDSAWEQVSIPHPVNAHDTFDEHAVDPGEASFRRDMMFYRKRFALSEGRGKMD